MKELKSILERFNLYITIVKWQPKDKNGNIIYGQQQAVQHFIKNYSKYNTWVSFTDLDEYIISPSNINLIKILINIEMLNKYSGIIMNQKKFLDRHLSKSKKILGEFKCINTIFKEGSKNIILTDSFKLLININDIICKKSLLNINSNILRFNHYNINNKQIKWLKSYYKKNITLDSFDYSMKKYIWK